MKPSTTAKRLHRLADYLNTVKPEVFDMHAWWVGPPKPRCGTTACAVGHAATMPYFYNLGLRLVTEPPCSKTCEHCNKNPTVQPVFKGEEGLQAAEAVFGVTHDESIYLFIGGTGDESPKDVARRLRAVAGRYAR